MFTLGTLPHYGQFSLEDYTRNPSQKISCIFSSDLIDRELSLRRAREILNKKSFDREYSLAPAMGGNIFVLYSIDQGSLPIDLILFTETKRETFFEI